MPTTRDRVYWAALRFYAQTGAIPAQSEIGEELGLYPQHVGRALRSLVERGRLVDPGGKYAPRHPALVVAPAEVGASLLRPLDFDACEDYLCAAASLEELAERLRLVDARAEELECSPVDFYDAAWLPVFGGEEPVSRWQVWAWDEARALVSGWNGGNGERWQIVARGEL